MAKKITIELEVSERDVILKHIWYALFDDVINSLKNAQPDKYGLIKCKVSKYELESMIGELSAVSNHAKSRQVQQITAEIAEHLEIYENRFPEKSEAI